MWRIVLCAVVCATLIAAEEFCQFSEQLTARSHWETHMVKERRRTDSYYKFHPTKLEVRDYSSQDKRVMTWLCEEQRSEDTYVLKLDGTGPDGNKQYICVQFVRRSTHVYQQRVSEVFTGVAESMCNNLELDDWPLVSPNLRGKEYSECPLQGGFAVDVRKYMQDVSLCKKGVVSSRLESECIKGEGITFNFRHIDCKGTLSMDLLQKLACLGTWEQDEYVYSILTDLDDLWPKLWMMRIPISHSHQEEMRAVLSMDIVADRGEYFGNDGLVPKERLFELVLTTELYPSLCENEANHCENAGMCGSTNRLFCQRECGVCEPVLSLHECHFDADTLGQWLEINKDSSRSLTITESMLYAEDLIPFQCYELLADKWFKGSGRKAMTTLFKNGCKPRYTCAEFQMKSSHVMTYRLSQSLVWPATLNVKAADVCSESQFRVDIVPLADKYRNKLSKVLIKHGSERPSVPCDISMSIGLSGIDAKGNSLLGVLWNSVFGYEDNSHSVMHEVCADGETKHQLRSLKCLASYHEDNTTQTVVMEDENLEVECWVFHRNVWERQMRVYVLHPAQCNPDMPYQIDFASSSHYKAKYDLLTLDENALDPCSKWTVGKKPLTPTIEPSVTKHDVNIVSGSANGAPEDWRIKVSGLSGATKATTGWWINFLFICSLCTTYY